MAIGTTAAIIGSAALGAGASALSAGAQSRAANRASQAQTESSQAAIAEQRRQFDETRRLLEPYVQAGTPALREQLRILGLISPEEQQAAIRQQEQNPFFQALARQGEEALLQRASATGGLRGGNVQGALAQFRPALLNQFIEQQYSRLGGLAGAGQNAAAGIGGFGAQNAANVGNLLVGQGQAAAGNALAQGQAQANLFGGLGQAAGTLGGFAAMGGFGGGGSGFNPALVNTSAPSIQFGAPLGGQALSLPSGSVGPLF
jgi:hypothetical protein